MAPRVIVVINQKGGVGKTTTALNLAVSLAAGGHRVMGIDLDPQGHFTLGLQPDSEDLPAEQTVAAVFGRGPSLAEILRPTREPNLQVLPANIRLARAAEVGYALIFRESRLRDALRDVQDEFHYILIDCGPSLGLLTVNGLVAATHAVIPTQPSLYSLQGLSDLLDTMHAVRSDARLDWRVLLTMVSGHAEERNQAAGKLLAPLSDRLLQTRIRRTEAIERSQMREDDQFAAVVLEKQSWNRGARDYRQLTKEIEALWPAA